MAPVQSWEDIYCQHVGYYQNEHGTGPHLPKQVHPWSTNTLQSWGCRCGEAPILSLLLQSVVEARDSLSCRLERLVLADTAWTPRYQAPCGSEESAWFSVVILQSSDWCMELLARTRSHLSNGLPKMPPSSHLSSHISFCCRSWLVLTNGPSREAKLLKRLSPLYIRIGMKPTSAATHKPSTLHSHLHWLSPGLAPSPTSEPRGWVPG